MGEESSVCEALQLLIWPSVKGVVGVRSFVRLAGLVTQNSLFPPPASLRSFSWGPPGLAPLAAGPLHAHLFYRCRLEVPMYPSAHVPMYSRTHVAPSLWAAAAVSSVPGCLCLPPAAIFWRRPPEDLRCSLRKTTTTRPGATVDSLAAQQRKNRHNTHNALSNTIPGGHGCPQPAALPTLLRRLHTPSHHRSSINLTSFFRAASLVPSILHSRPTKAKAAVISRRAHAVETPLCLQ